MKTLLGDRPAAGQVVSGWMNALETALGLLSSQAV
jgi:hypothetical protein